MKWYSIVVSAVLSILALAAGGFGALCVLNKSPTQGLILIAMAFLLIIVLVGMISSERRFAKESVVYNIGHALAETECDCWFDGENYENVNLSVNRKALCIKSIRGSDVNIPYESCTVQSAIRGSDTCASNLIFVHNKKGYDCVIPDTGSFDYIIDALQEASGNEIAVSHYEP